MRYALLLSIVISVLIAALLTVVGLNYYSNSTSSTVKLANKSGANLKETTDPTSLASDVKTQVELKSIQTGLTVYFSEYGYYPIDLGELKTNGSLNDIDVRAINYTRCDSDTVVVKKGSGGFKLENDQLTSGLSC